MFEGANSVLNTWCDHRNFDWVNTPEQHQIIALLKTSLISGKVLISVQIKSYNRPQVETIDGGDKQKGEVTVIMPCGEGY